jgi:hypothetical protein
MPRHTRRNPQGPLLDKHALGEVLAKMRGAPQERRLQQAMKQMGVKKITADNLDRVLEVAKEIQMGHRGGTRRHRKHRHTRRR